MTELTTKLIQRQTLSPGRINLNQRHCYDTAIQTQTNRLMQRLELPEKWMRRYTGGVLQPDAIAQRFNLRRIELTEWGQLADVKVLPGKLQSTVQSHPFVSPATSSLNSASVSTPAAISVSTSASSPNLSLPAPVSTSTSPETEVLTSQTSPRSRSLEKSDVPSLSSSSTTLNTPSALPEATFRIRRGGSPSAAIASNSTLPSDGINHSGGGGSRAHPMQNSERQEVAPMRSMSYPTQDSFQPQGITPTGRMAKINNASKLDGETSSLVLARSPIANSPPQTLEMASEGGLVLPGKGKLAQAQRTIESTDPVLPIAVKARVERSQLAPEQAHASQPERIAVKPQLNLPLAPTVSTSAPNQTLPLVQKQIQPLSETPIDESVPVLPTVTHQQQRIASKTPTTSVEAINIDKVAAEVSRLLSRRLLLERERRGIRP